MEKVERGPSAGSTLGDNHSCEVLHVTDRNYQALKERKTRNRIMSSCLTSLEDEIKPQGLGLKFVADGQENYWLRNKRYHLTDGKYLLVNESLAVLDITINNRVGTKAICVDIDSNLVNELLLQMIYPDELDNYNTTSQYLLTPELFVNEARADTRLQELLQYIMTSSAAGTLDRPAMELIYELTTLVVKGSTETIRSYYKLDTAKLSTRKEVFKRLLTGKEMLDDSIFSELSIRQVAESSCLSEFRFYRLFKQCFGDSPYNYLFKKRIDKSIELRKQGLTWVDIATQLNFTDLAAFSKSFKKIKGVSPSKIVL